MCGAYFIQCCVVCGPETRDKTATQLENMFVGNVAQDVEKESNFCKQYNYFFKINVNVRRRKIIIIYIYWIKKHIKGNMQASQNVEKFEKI